jgi:uncharacterized protein YjbI with pentapeptide repeats
VSGANLEKVDLYNADLRWTNLEGAALSEANLSGARYNNAAIWPDGFDPKAAGAINVDEA